MIDEQQRGGGGSKTYDIEGGGKGKTSRGKKQIVEGSNEKNP